MTRVSSPRVTQAFIILDGATVDYACYIEKVLPAALKYGNKVFGND